MQEALRVQLRKLLQQDDELRHEITCLLQSEPTTEPPQMQINQEVVGNRNQVIGSTQGTVTYYN